MQKYLVKNATGDLELKIYDTIGRDWFFDEISAADIISQIENAQPSSLTVRINSGGGSVWEGVAIYNYLKNFKGRVKVVVDGIAASIASVIAMAGTSIEMGEGTFLMIHDPFMGVVGNAEELRKMADFLEKVGGELANVYVAKTGLSKEQITQMMKAETWISSSEAVEMGFATKAKGVKADVESVMNMAASITGGNKLVKQLNNHRMDENKTNVFDTIKNFFKSREEVQEVENQIIEPVKSEYEAKLKAEKEAKEAIEAKLADAQAEAEKAKELQNQFDTLKAEMEKLKESGKPQTQVTDDKNEDEGTNLSPNETVEAKLLSIMNEAQVEMYNRQKELNAVRLKAKLKSKQKK